MYPVMLQLRGEKIVIVGGGRIAERKTLALLEAGADGVVLISPVLTPHLQALANEGAIQVHARPYRTEDAGGARLLFAATDEALLNQEIADDGRRAGAWVNIADDASGSAFANPAVVRRGDLLLAVSASGASPALAARIKGELEQAYGEEYEAAVQRLRRLRERAKAVVEDPNERHELLRLAAAEAPHMQEGDDELDAWLERLQKLITEGFHNGNDK
ncbi:precorrin-2 dehydrogenase/sirohydrochlorin ferrochelatase family protein [Paenibacillus radicis (ex Gao et al. 2016)]|uniref:precorrin-2 dehydrogenase n=1 Tax=Paenibacillus radicis (ex Gao et al. 2016) TaxID=1737354 RepID=A0A917M468_9BACL|nr:bifunctional precorrin-2 dehydrogenase/sirohydrochlorin ferrochelatase [Paenibacillus radicis (ex Gao et al. 2016)]GGG74414.1 siroheme synthase [Paenibacillus radicis (ex Gao et al. 2016)]